MSNLKIKQGLKELGIENADANVPKRGPIAGEEPPQAVVDGSQPNERGPYRPSILVCARCHREVTPGTPCCDVGQK